MEKNEEKYFECVCVLSAEGPLYCGYQPQHQCPGSRRLWKPPALTMLPFSPHSVYLFSPTYSPFITCFPMVYVCVTRGV